MINPCCEILLERAYTPTIYDRYTSLENALHALFVGELNNQRTRDAMEAFTAGWIKYHEYLGTGL